MQQNDPLEIVGKRVRCHHNGLGDEAERRDSNDRWIEGTVTGVDVHLVQLGSVKGANGATMRDQVINTRCESFIRFELLNT